jgi:hypothetical protein
MPLLVRDALTHRRQVARHAASMLATVLLVLPPVLARLAPIIPGFPPDFVLACNTGQLVAAAIGVMLWLRDRRFGGAFLAVAALQATQSAIFALYGGTMIARALATPPPLALATIAALATLAMLWLAWRPLRPLARPAAAV